MIRIQNAAGFAKTCLQIEPVMGGEPAENGIKTGGGKGKLFGCCLTGCNVPQASFLRFYMDSIQHGLCDVTSDNTPYQWRCAIADMAAPAAKIQNRS